MKRHEEKRTKHRMTRQRRVILEVLREDQSHPTADQIYDAVKQRLPRISMGTVYRNLEVLVSEGHIQRIQTERAPMRFDSNPKPHYHLTCIACGRVEDAPFEPSEDPIINIETALGKLNKYGIFGHKVEFFGLCRSCREARGPEHDLVDKPTDRPGAA